MINRGSDQSLQEVHAERRDLGVLKYPLVAQGGEVDDLPERLLLPFEVVRLLLRQALLRGSDGGQSLLSDGSGEDGLAERGDGVLEGGVICRAVCVHHLCFEPLIPT